MKKLTILSILLALLALVVFSDGASTTIQPGHASNTINQNLSSYMPLVMNDFRDYNPFGTESSINLLPGSLITSRASDLGISLMRLNERISWRLLQPNQGDPINWELLADFEAELVTLSSAGIKPIVVVDDYPAWATDNTARWDGLPTACGPLRDDRLADYASFVQALVARYKTPEFNVHDWELGNEPDVDPNLVQLDNSFGCYGDIDDPFYGGERYGRMIITVGAAIKAEDPNALVWLGGLLLANPNPDLYPPTCGLADCGHPELFFQGVLQSGAAAYFDVVPYHSYPSYINRRIDHDTGMTGPWADWGGWYLGKARFLRSFMAQYGVEKPLFINETAMTCPDNNPWFPWCNPPAEDYFQMQADFLVRAYVRGFSENISGYFWFTLNDTEWRYSSLLDGNDNPRPAYNALQQLIIHLQAATYIGPASYEPGIEAYAFDNQAQRIHVIWSTTDAVHIISIPEPEFIAAYTRDGAPITSIPYDYIYLLPVQFEPIYVILEP